MPGRTGTSWQPGTSGNPKGRPPKERALTALLEAAGSKTVLVDGRPVSGKRALAMALWGAALQGATTLYDADGTRLEFSPRDWLDIAKFLYGQIDGPPKQEHDITSNGQPLNAGPNLKALSADELATLETLLSKADRA